MLEKICKCLSMQCRFGGDVRRFYSVAEHTVHMVNQAQEDGVSRNIRLAMWLHDSPEYLTGDLLPPVKTNPIIAAEYSRIEGRVMQAICHRLDVSPDMGAIALGSEIVKKYDQAILAAEAQTVAGPQPNWDPFDETDRLHVAFDKRIQSVEWLGADFHYWQNAMMAQFEELTQ